MAAKMSEEARRNQSKAQLEWHKENYDAIKFSVKKGKREAYKRLAEAKETSLAGLIQDALDCEYEKTFGEKP